MAVNFNQTSDLMLLELLNQANEQYNATPLTFGKIQFGAPTESIQGQRNTICSVSPAANSNVIGSPIPIRYPRLDFGVFFVGGINIELPEGDAVPATTADLLPYINELYSLELRNSDIVIANITDPAEITLQAHPLSYVWMGSTEVVIAEAPVNINTLVVVTDLGQFDI